MKHISRTWFSLCIALAALFLLVVPAAADDYKQVGVQSVIALFPKQATPVLGASDYKVYTVKTYSSLTAKQKKIYDWVKSALYGSSTKTISKTFYCTLNDYWNAYYAINDTFFQYYSVVPFDAYAYAYYGSDYAIHISFNCKAARGRWKRSESNKALVAARTKTLLSGVSSTRVKVLRIRNYVCNKLKYRLSSPGTLDTSLRGSYAKCSGYASLFQAMCLAADIPCRQVIGRAYSNDADSMHDWNRVKIGSQWYYSDPTWYDEDRSSTWSLKTKLWTGRTKEAELCSINFKSRGWVSDLFD